MLSFTNIISSTLSQGIRDNIITNGNKSTIYLNHPIMEANSRMVKVLIIFKHNIV